MRKSKGKPAPWPGRVYIATKGIQQEQREKDTTARRTAAQPRKEGLRHISECLADLLQP